MYSKVARGEGALTIWNMPDTVMLKETKNYPFDFVIPESGTPVLTEGIALVKGGQHPQGGKGILRVCQLQTGDEASRQNLLPHSHPKRYTRFARLDRKNPHQSMDLDWRLLQEKENEWMDHWDQKIKNKAKQKRGIRSSGIGGGWGVVYCHSEY